MMSVCREQIGRRTRASVEKLVSAADREIGPGTIEVDFDRTGAVAQIPYDQRARRMRLARDFRHVADSCGFVVNLCEQ